MIASGMSDVRIDVWIWPLDVSDSVRASLRLVLSADERARADRFVFSGDRDAYVVARGHMRRLLAELTGVEPHDITFAYGPSGKPSLQSGPHFNLTHSGGMAALAVCREHPLGIDIEKVRDVGDGIAGRFFSKGENDALAAAGDDRRQAFFRCWTRKEAVLKAVGCGLNRDTRSFCVEIGRPDEPGQRFAATGIEDDPAEDCAWALIDLDPGDGFAGAVAVKCGVRIPRLAIMQGPVNHWPNRC